MSSISVSAAADPSREASTYAAATLFTHDPAQTGLKVGVLSLSITFMMLTRARLHFLDRVSWTGQERQSKG